MGSEAAGERRRKGVTATSAGHSTSVLGQTSLVRVVPSGHPASADIVSLARATWPRRGCRPWSGRSRAGAAGPASRAVSLADEGLRAPAAAVLNVSEPNVQVGGAPVHGSLLSGLDGAAGSRGIESIHVVDQSASSCAGAKSESSHHPNHMRPADGGAFISQSKSSVQSLLHAAIFPDSETLHHTSVACDSCARQLITDASVNDGRTVVRPLQTERSTSKADDNGTALYASPTERFTELGMSVSLRIFIQLRKDNGRRRTLQLCQ
jgi:hypothetical protein